MKKHFWKIEYSITLIAIFAVLLAFWPTSFSSHEARYISLWNQQYGKIDYMFSAMNAQADADIIKGIKNAKTDDQREFYMMRLVKPFLRLRDEERLTKHYKLHYMNGKEVSPNDLYYFDNLYLSEHGKVVGIKDIKNDNKNDSAGFMMMVDMNGIMRPNAWGKDVYGVRIYSDGRITALGKGLSIDELKKDCSESGTGVSCSYYYRIGGDFNE